MADPTAQSPQLSFPLLDSPLLSSVKNDRTMMVFNFFHLGRETVTELPKYDDGTVSIEVKGTQEGVANIWDKEVLIYLISLLQNKINLGQPLSRVITFAPNDFFRICQILPGGTAYKRLDESLTRLQGTQIKTNIRTGGEGEKGAFSWINRYKLKYRQGKNKEEIAHGLEVEICDWLYRAIVKDGKILTYHMDYFTLAPIEKRLYEVARAHCGAQNSFRMNIEKLRVRVGTQTDLRTFKKNLAAMAALPQSPIPEYGMVLTDPKSPLKPRIRVPLTSWQVFFYRLDKRTQMAPPSYAPLIDGDFD